MTACCESAKMPEKLEFAAKPPMLPVYLRVFTKGKTRFKAGQTLPAMSAVWRGAGESRALIAAYRQLCGLPSGDTLPILYPYVMVARMHMTFMASSAFPISPLGAVHARNSVLQRRAIGENETFDLHCAVAGQRVLKAGLEFFINSWAEKDGAILWECASTYLVRGKSFGEPDGPSPVITALPELEHPNLECGWDVPENTGRRYAKICGDYNPIHLRKTLAKLFGFPSHLVHGMWSLARCTAHLPAPDTTRPVRLDAAFKGPVFLGSRVTMKARSEGESHRFDLFCADNPRPVIVGALCPADPGDTLLSS
jgi:hypothetical protein